MDTGLVLVGTSELGHGTGGALPCPTRSGRVAASSRSRLGGHHPIFAFSASNNLIALPISAFCRSGSCGISRSMVKGPV